MHAGRWNTHADDPTGVSKGVYLVHLYFQTLCHRRNTHNRRSGLSASQLIHDQPVGSSCSLLQCCYPSLKTSNNRINHQSVSNTNYTNALSLMTKSAPWVLWGSINSWKTEKKSSMQTALLLPFFKACEVYEMFSWVNFKTVIWQISDAVTRNTEIHSFIHVKLACKRLNEKIKSC